MKKRNTVLILGIISIILLITVQVIIITGVWRQKDEMFNLRYRFSSQDALASQNRRLGTDGFDTARMMIDNFAEKAVAEISQMTDSAAIELKKKDFLYFVRFVLNEEQDLSGLISIILNAGGLIRTSSII